jgi:D-3-phosphoglycerate dehydrogenase
MSSRYRVGLSQDLRRLDGSAVIAEFDSSPLDAHPAVEVEVLPVNGHLDPQLLSRYDAVILMLERVDARSFDGPGRLGLIARFGVGYDLIDVEACSANGVALAITPDGVRRPVAVVIMTFLLALTGRLMVKDALTREGRSGWARKTDYNGMGLVGRTFGALGLGNIGAEAFRLAAPFGMRHIAHDPFADSGLAAELGVELVELDTLFADSDVLSVSCPLDERTRGIVNAERLALMKPTAYLINAARGPIVDQAALTEALQQGRIAGAGLDVFEREPPEDDDPLLRLDNVILAPHALCFTDQCMYGNGKADTDAILAVLSGQAPRHVVNAAVLDTPLFRQRLQDYARGV